MSFDKYIRICIHCHTTIQNSFTVLKITWVLFIPPSILTPGNYTPFYYLHSFTISRKSFHWNHTICSIFGLVSFILLTYIENSFLSFHTLIVHLVLGMNNIQLSGYVSFFLSTHLLKNILFASKFCEL